MNFWSRLVPVSHLAGHFKGGFAMGWDKIPFVFRTFRAPVLVYQLSILKMEGQKIPHRFYKTDQNRGSSWVFQARH